MPKKTQQINIHGPDLLSLDSIDYPLLESNDLIVEIKCCGICGTDLGYLSSFLLTKVYRNQSKNIGFVVF